MAGKLCLPEGSNALALKDGAFQWIEGTKLDGCEIITSENGFLKFSRIESGEIVGKRNPTEEEAAELERMPHPPKPKKPTLKEIVTKAETIAKKGETTISDLAELMCAIANKIEEVANQDPGVARRAKLVGKRVDL